MPQEVDRTRVEKLAVEILQAVRREMAEPPFTRDNVFIPLNALAFAAATIIAGVRNDPVARDFFAKAVNQNISLLLEDS
jgi:hypothetical protein